MITMTTRSSISVKPLSLKRVAATYVTLSFFIITSHRNIVDTENRREHRDNDGADDETHADDHDGFQHRGEPRRRALDLLVVVLGYIREHAFEATGFLPDGDHVEREGRKQPALGQRPDHPFALADAHLDLRDGARDQAVADNALNGSERVE